MTFGFTEDQNELRSTAARFLEEKSSSSTVRELMETEAGFDEGTWKQMADLGWFGMAIPEEYGGIGFGFVEVTVLMEEMGKSLLPAPFLSTVVLGANAILNAGTDDQKKELLPGIADGTTRAALAFVEPSASGRSTRSSSPPPNPAGTGRSPARRVLRHRRRDREPSHRRREDGK